MERLTKNPGLQHVAEDIFGFLDKKNLMDCRLVNKSWKEILEGPVFWLKKLDEENRSEDDQRRWKNLAQELELDQAKEFGLVFTKMYKGTLICPLTLTLELRKANKYHDLVNFILEHEEPNSRVAYFTRDIPKNPSEMYSFWYSYPDWIYVTPMHLAALFGLTGVVEKRLQKLQIQSFLSQSKDKLTLQSLSLLLY